MGDIDNLINSLDQQLSSYANPSARGTCSRCKKDILGKMVDAMKRQWHEECWRCNGCNRLIGTDDFYAHDNYALCDSCEKEKFLPDCGKCGNRIDGLYTEALGKKYHPEHFCCQRCEKHLPDGTFYQSEGKALCLECASA